MGIVVADQIALRLDPQEIAFADWYDPARAQAILAAQENRERADITAKILQRLLAAV